jgi:hypothetical protein
MIFRKTAQVWPVELTRKIAEAADTVVTTIPAIRMTA